MRPVRLFAVFILLSLITVLLLGYSIRFFNAAAVRMQISAWANQIASSASNRAWTAPPQPTAASPRNAAVVAEPESALRPTATPRPTQPLLAEPVIARSGQDVEPGPVKVEATPEPVFMVIEAPPPDGSLVIPALGIDQPLVTVPVRDQEWDLENLGSQIGWLQTTGSHPKDDLAMVLIGHITLPYPGGAGPFLNLSTLKPGDVIGYRSGQATYIYEVKRQTIVKPDQVDLLYRRNGKVLLLVTCTGYNALEWEYDLRLIVEAVLVADHDPSVDQ